MDSTTARRLGFLNKIHWEKTVIWTLFLLFLYVIRAFFALAFLTFILSYIFHHLSQWILGHFFPHRAGRWSRVLVISGLYLVLLGGVTVGAILIGPGVYSQADRLISKVEQLEEGRKLAEGMVKDLSREVDDEGAGRTRPFLDRLLTLPAEEEDKVRSGLSLFLRSGGSRPGLNLDEGEEGAGSGRNKKKSPEKEKVDQARNQEPLPPESPAVKAKIGEYVARIRDFHRKKGLQNAVGTFLAESLGIKQTAKVQTMVAQGTKYVLEHIPSTVAILRQFLGSLFKGMVHIFLAVIFSYLILLDLPRIGNKVDTLARSRISRFYEEIKPTMVTFTTVIGKAFQAQAVIAFLNTAFTFVGIRLLGLPHSEVLAVIVFIRSFVPVVGVFISTAPMVLVALQMPSGVKLALWVIALITLIHMLEAYVFNPRIMGEFLHMHPLFVLLILVTAEHFFHVWGLLLGVPVVYYIFTYVLNRPVPGGRGT